MRRTRILIADDHALLRAGLRMLLDAQRDMRVVGEAADAAGTVRLARETDADVLLLDLAMPGAAGTSVVEQVVNERSQLKVLVLTMHDDPTYARAALNAGAVGYVVKKAADTELLSAIRATRGGRTFVDVTAAGRTARDLLGRGRGRGHARPGASLSKREAQVLELLARGHTNREIAESIGVGVKTVETYRSRATQKIGARSRADIVRYALEAGLLGRKSAPQRGA